MNTSFTNTNDPLSNKTVDCLESNQLRSKVHELAEAAFHRHLISGHGDGEYNDEYQIVYQGKPKHLSLSGAHAFLTNLLQRPT